MKKYIIFILISAIFGSGLAQENIRLRILTYNIYHGATMKGDFNLDTIADVIASFNPDLVALQEVDRLTNRAKKMDLVTELGYRTKMAPVFARAMYYDSGEYGEGILSKYSFLQTKNHPLSALPGHEPRAAMEVLVELANGDTIAFVGTHLEHNRNAPDRITQANELAKLYSDYPYPVILAGDLNDIPESDALHSIRQVFNLTAGENPEPTIPSTGAKRKIDYILTDKAHQWKVIETQVVCDQVVSDHCCYFVILELIK